MESRIGLKTRANRTLSIEDVTEAFIKCNDHFDEMENPRVKWKGKQKGNTQNADPENHINKQGVIEHHGVMFMYRKELAKSRRRFKQISGRLAQICFKTKEPDLIITDALAPHTM